MGIVSPTLPMSAYNKKPPKPNKIPRVIELSPGDWQNNQQTKKVEGVTSTNIVTISPTPESFLNYMSCTIRGILQMEDALVFKCESTPTMSIFVNVVIDN